MSCLTQMYKSGLWTFLSSLWITWSYRSLLLLLLTALRKCQVAALMLFFQLGAGAFAVLVDTQKGAWSLWDRKVTVGCSYPSRRGRWSLSFGLQTKNKPAKCMYVCVCVCVKIYLCAHKHVWEPEQEMARMCRIPNFPHGLFLGRKLQLSFHLSVPLTEDGRDLWVGEGRPFHPVTPPQCPSGWHSGSPENEKKGFSII